MSVNNYDGFNELFNELNSLIQKVENPVSILEVGAKSFVKDLLKLSKPHSKIRSSGYTHLVDSFCYEIKNEEIVIGWGKYYGRMVEDGTIKTRSQPHLKPTFERNKKKYYDEMINDFYK